MLVPVGEVTLLASCHSRFLLPGGSALLFQPSIEPPSLPRLAGPCYFTIVRTLIPWFGTLDILQPDIQTLSQMSKTVIWGACRADVVTDIRHPAHFGTLITCQKRTIVDLPIAISWS